MVVAGRLRDSKQGDTHLPRKPVRLRILGIDIGQSNDYTALCGLEVRQERNPAKAAIENNSYYGNIPEVAARAKRGEWDKPDITVGEWKRFPQRISPTTWRADVARIVKDSNDQGFNVRIAVDCSAFHLDDADQLIKACRQAGARAVVTATMTTNGGVVGGPHRMSDYEVGRYWTIPKKHLVGLGLAALDPNQRPTVKVSDRLPHRREVVEELRNFTPKKNAETGHVSYEHKREGDFDDLIMAFTLAIWSLNMGQRQPVVIPLRLQ